MRLEGTNVVVTGAGGGIGAALARGFARECAAVVCTDLDPDRAAAVAEEIRGEGGSAFSCGGDLTDYGAVEALATTAVESVGDVHVLVANAGGSQGDVVPFIDLDPDRWQQMVGRNLTATFYTCLAFARQMVSSGNRGAIVVTTSQLAEVVRPGMAHYATAKGGVKQLVRAMAVDLAEHDIRVNALAPGPTLTPGNTAMFSSPQMQSFHENAIPLGRIARPEEMVGAAIYLASEEASFTTGTTILVDGGYCLT